MSIWKSPIFYLSILLLLIVSAAILAPFVVDWSTYRTDLERYGERLSGRAVRIDGPISVRLFPFPQISGERVSIAETDDPNSPKFVQADRVAVRVALAGLLSWQLRVEDITIDSPDFNLVRDADGNGNWVMLPQEELRSSRLLESVRLDRIFLNNGKVHFSDKSRDGKLDIEVDAATFSAPSIEGPWKSTGTIAVYGIQSNYVFSSSSVTGNNPLKVGLKLLPKDKQYPVLSFDGVRSADLLAGNIRAEGATVSDSEKQDQNAPPPTPGFPVKITGALQATGKHVSISSLQLVPAKNDDSSTLIQGNVDIDIGDRVVAVAQLTAPRINIDSLLGESAKQGLSAQRALNVLSAGLKSMPDNLEFRVVLDAASLKTGGETLESAVLAADINKEAARIKRISINLPGRSRLLADGTVFAGQGSGEFAGKMAVESSDLRQLSSWLWPLRKPQIAKYWTGSRGQFKLQSNVNVSDALLSFAGAEFELDGQRGNGDFRFQSGSAAGTDITLKIDTLDLDNFVQDGFQLTGPDKSAALTDFIAALAGLASFADTQIAVSSDAIVLNGIRGRNFRVDGGIGKQGLLVRTLELALLGDAQVTAQGQVLLNQGVPEGSLDAGVAAQDPLPLLQLMGLVHAGDNAPWQSVLGNTQVSSKLAFGHTDQGPVANLKSVGRSGPININSAVSFSDITLSDNPSVKGFLDLSSDDEADIGRLGGITSRSADKRPGRINASFDGSARTGFNIAVQVDALAAKGTFEGLYKPSPQDVMQVEGRLSITADKTASVLRSVGMPLANGSNAPLSLEAKITPQLDMLRFENVRGKFSGEEFSGELDLARDRSINADFSVESLTLPQFLASVLLPWDGSAASRDSNFEDSAPFGVNGEFWLRPRTFSLFDGMPLNETVLGLVVEGRERQITLAARSASGEAVSVEAALLPSGGQYSLDITGKAPLQLQQLFTFVEPSQGLGGQVMVEGKATGSGLTPAAALTDLTGAGHLTMTGVTLNKFSPEVFARTIGIARNSDALRASIASLQGAEGYSVADADLSFKINLGRVVVEPFTNQTPSGTLSFDVSADLAERALTAVVGVAVNGQQQIPPAKLWLEGTANQVRRRIETSAIAAKLGYDIMAKEMAELEKAQQEQQRIIEQEEAQRKLDAEKFQAYQEQRAELRLRQRELKVLAVQRTHDADLAKQQFDAQATVLAAMNKLELARRIRVERVMLATIGGLPSRAVKSKRKFVVIEQLPPGFVLPEAPVSQP